MSDTADVPSHMAAYEQDGKVKKTTYTFFRGTNSNFHPTDESLGTDTFVSTYLTKGWMPDAPFVDKSTPIVAFGSCFAANISNYLHRRGYNILTKKDDTAYVSSMGDGIVNTFAIRQQFEWAWENVKPDVELWHGYKAETFGYRDVVRLRTKDLFDQTELFIITMGLSEVWYDKPTGAVFWRAIPKQNYDPKRHDFRVTTVSENLENIRAIRSLIHRHKPDARVIFTLSPVPLTATFRPVSCVSANSVSKAILRAAIDEFMQTLPPDLAGTNYFPSYEMVLNGFDHPMMEDRKHPHQHVLTFNMKAFERYYCDVGMSDADLEAAYQEARAMDLKVATQGHFAVPRTMTPAAGGAQAPKA
ncbi:GSCFA domain-containing protein [Falsiroseomonas selenitidurans]|uniref:GSCFA domain-containing protein n=1 Tax=Falsiroseomonas selenitidurans TaxID=2716335 RepID=A0ABX1E8Q6_9PROT|nr:GSCFA domain-containing protein [Falsiroseomonas selenitidurans]NKC33572.1 GSCFA domain-containing protein [Falsiroseomonas selenitidurans]